MNTNIPPLSLMIRLLTACFTSLVLVGSASATSPLCKPYVVLQDQDYALCAGAPSWNFDSVTYAKCQKMKGDSISLPQSYPVPSKNPTGNIESVNQIGLQSGTFVVSTYSPPQGATSPSGNLALYTCNKSGSYAQCDGGLCFKNTSGTTFPGLGEVGQNEIVCSCPIATSSKSYQVYGPYPCPTTRAEYDSICGSGNTSSKNGHVLYIGAPAGGSRLFANCLSEFEGTEQVKFNVCKRPNR